MKPLPRRRGPVRFPVLTFWASLTNSPINLLYVSESCCNASRICSRYVNSADVLAVWFLKSSRYLLSFELGSRSRLSGRSLESVDTHDKGRKSCTSIQLQQCIDLRFVQVRLGTESQLRSRQGCASYSRLRRARARGTTTRSGGSLLHRRGVGRRGCGGRSCVDFEGRKLRTGTR